MYSYVARQPILDRDLNTYGYELLFRNSLSNVFPGISSQQATSCLVVQQFLQQNIEVLLGDLPGFVNFPYSLLLDGLAECLPPGKIGIEILEDCPPDDALFAKVKQLHQLGFTLALDDFTLAPEWARFLPFIHIIKFDLQATPLSDIQAFIDRHQALNLIYLAEKVENQAEFESAKALGIQLFQGYFFSRPEIVKQVRLAPAQVVVMELLTLVNEPHPDIHKIETLLRRDIPLSVKLLRYINYLNGASTPIHSFRQAALSLCNNQLKRFVALVATASVGQGRRVELYRMSMIRARFCELLAQTQPTDLAPQAFMAGLFSLLDVLMAQPMNALLGSMPLSEEITLALLERDGSLGFLLTFCEHYETANWSEVTISTAILGLDEQAVSQRYLCATTWVNEQLLAMEPVNT
ncbi:MAG: EAL and HDOD domain-containing protein [Aeromonas sp.]